MGTGPNAGRPGHRPTDRRVEEGDFLSVCLGASYRGYRCEIGRTFVIGTSPADWQIELYDLVFAAQRAGRESLTPGAAYRDVDRAARQVLESGGHHEGLPTLTGHGVGLEIDEDPQLAPAAMGKLDACVPVTVEPGVHLPGRGGVGSMTRSSYAPRRTADPSYSPSRPRSCSRCRSACAGVVHVSPGDSATVASTNDLKNGLVLKLEGGQLWSVVEFQHVKPGKGPAFVRTKLKNVLSGKVVDKTFNAGVKVETATVDKRDMQFSYMDGEYFVFMDMETYDQLMIDRKAVGDAANFLIEGFTATVAQHEGEVLFVELPAAVELVVQETEPGLQGDRSTGGTKPATLETGHQIQVPLFITTGEKIKVDTRTSDYLGRVNS